MVLKKDIRILVVDDQTTMRSLIKTILRQLDFVQIAEAENFHSALNKITDGGVDFVLLDWNMPGRSGIELLKVIRELPKYSKLPVLMVTAEAKHNNIMEAIKANVSGYLVKPINAKALGEKIDDILEKL